MNNTPGTREPDPDAVRYDAVVIGAGFAGMYMLHRLRGLGLTARVYEAGTGVGGTWYWNRYPGARCDVESMEYSYGFSDELQQEWNWTERYATQPEILEYANHVADRFDLRTDIQFGTGASLAAHFDEASTRWMIDTDQGDAVSAQFLITAMGCLSEMNKPDIPGIDSFAGETYYTGRWPHGGVDFTGRRVGMIGTGSSAIQSIPLIAEQAAHLTVFQRTANYSIPAHNGPLDAELEAEIKAEYTEFRAANRTMVPAFGSRSPANDNSAVATAPDERLEIFEDRWARGGLAFLGAFNDLLLDFDANALAAEFVRRKIHQIVDDPDDAELLTPKSLIGCKRLCVDSGYYETFNRDNVTLVDISTTPIAAITPTSLRVGDDEYGVDDLVMATGFDAMTGALLAVDIRGRDGRTLADAWQDGPVTYLGLGVADFPNLFTISGPGSPSALTNMFVSIEQHVDFIAECVEYLRANDYRTIEPTVDAQDAWVDHVRTIADFTVYPHCNSWYLGANVPGKPRVFMTLLGFPPYAEKCNQVAANGYEGFVLSDA